MGSQFCTPGVLYRYGTVCVFLSSILPFQPRVHTYKEGDRVMLWGPGGGAGPSHTPYAPSSPSLSCRIIVHTYRWGRETQTPHLGVDEQSLHQKKPKYYRIAGAHSGLARRLDNPHGQLTGDTNCLKYLPHHSLPSFATWQNTHTMCVPILVFLRPSPYQVPLLKLP